MVLLRLYVALTLKQTNYLMYWYTENPLNDVLRWCLSEIVKVVHGQKADWGKAFCLDCLIVFLCQLEL